jgi:hypothetical protein
LAHFDHLIWPPVETETGYSVSGVESGKESGEQEEEEGGVI